MRFAPVVEAAITFALVEGKVRFHDWMRASGFLAPLSAIAQ